VRGCESVEAVRASRSRAFKDPPEDWGGYMQTDDGFEWDSVTNTLTHINTKPIELDKEYKIGCLYLSLSGMNRNQPLIDFANASIAPQAFTQLGDTGRGAKELIVDNCSRHILAQLGTFEDIDRDHDGTIDLAELDIAMGKVLGRPVRQIEVQQLLDSLKHLDPAFKDDEERISITKDLFGKAIQAHLVSMGSDKKLL
jgi:hypothetical protein